MENKNRIGGLQIIAFSYILSSSLMTGICVKVLFDVTAQNTWISVFIGKALGLAIVLIYIYILNRQGNLSVMELNKKLFGKVFGNIINFVLMGFFVVFFLTSMWMFGEFFSSQFLVETPPLAINLLFAGVIILALRYGLESFSRLIQIQAAISGVTFFLILTGTISEFELSNVKPFFEPGFMNIMKNALIIAISSAAPVFLLNAIPQNQITKKRDIWKYILIGYGISFVFDVSAFFLMASYLGANLIHFYGCPIYAVIKKVKILGFIERVENILIMRKLFFIVAWLLMLSYSITENIKQTFKIKKKKIKAVLIIVIVLVLTYFSKNIFPHHINANDWFSMPFVILLSISCLLIPLIIMLRLKFGKKKLLK